MKPYPNTPRYNAVAAVLQFHWHDIDPDSSRTLAVKVIETLDRVDGREAKEQAALEADIAKAVGQ